MGWQRLWENPEIAAQWAELPPLQEVVEMADLLEAAGLRSVLDIGCGMGRHLVYLAARGFEVIGTDHAPAAIASCTESLAAAGLSADVRLMDMADFPFPDASFGGVISSHVIHHGYLADIEAILANITRVLVPRGYFVFACPTPDHFEATGEEVEPGTFVDPNNKEGPVPHHFFTEEGLRELLHAYDLLTLQRNDSVEEGTSRSRWSLLAQKRA
jgi:tellurite methyltransferase